MSLNELATVQGNLGLPIEPDRYFKPTGPLSAYANHARLHGRIVS